MNESRALSRMPRQIQLTLMPKKRSPNVTQLEKANGSFSVVCGTGILTEALLAAVRAERFPDSFLAIFCARDATRRCFVPRSTPLCRPWHHSLSPLLCTERTVRLIVKSSIPLFTHYEPLLVSITTIKPSIVNQVCI